MISFEKHEFCKSQGGTAFADGWGFATRFSESYPLLVINSCRHTYFYDEFWQNTTHNFYNFCQCLENPPMFKDAEKGILKVDLLVDQSFYPLLSKSKQKFKIRLQQI